MGDKEDGKNQTDKQNVKMKQAADVVVVIRVEKQQAGSLEPQTFGTGSQPQATPPTTTTLTHHTLTAVHDLSWEGGQKGL